MRALVALVIAGCSSSEKAPPAQGAGPLEPGETMDMEPVPPAGMDFGVGDSEGAREGEGASCLGESREAERRGLDIFIMLDISGSMLDPLPGQNILAAPTTKWDAVRASLETFVQAPETADIGVGLQYFPQLEPGVPFSCEQNDQCGAVAGPCSNSMCVVSDSVDDDPTDAFAPLSFTRIPLDGPRFCFDDSGCTGAGETCRTILGECVVPPGVFADVPQGSFLNMNPDPAGRLLSPLCEVQQDCAGLPGTSCDQVGVCQDLLNFCTPSLACPLGSGACAALPTACVNQTRCDAADYSTPAVAISRAPDRSAALVASLQSQVPAGLTPTGPALRGALEQAQAWAAQHPDRQVITLLVTDGFPTECAPTEIPEVAAIAQAASGAERPVRTFVIGVFSDADLGNDGQARLDVVARAGNTSSALIVNTASDVNAEFLRALESIRDSSLSCDFQLEAGAVLDFESVNLTVTDPSGARAQLFRVNGMDGCAGDDRGWYYVQDSGGTPTQISVCPGVCETLQLTGAKADLQVGCATRIR